MRIEKQIFQDLVGSVRIDTPAFRVISRRMHGPWSPTKFDALSSWALGRFGIGMQVGDQYCDKGIHQHRVYAAQVSRRSGRYCKTRLGAIVSFIFKPKHRV